MEMQQDLLIKKPSRSIFLFAQHLIIEIAASATKNLDSSMAEMALFCFK
jgi:hypothetical protein